MKLYNTLSKQVEEFIPNDPNNIKIYTCGPTVYDYAHIGNLRTYLFEDILVKSLKYLNYTVTRVMNITDVGHLTSDADTGDDKLEKGALREGKSVLEIASFYTNSFFKDCEKLNIAKPDIIEKASDHIDTYIKIIEKLIQNDFAYVANGNVYFDISKAKDYYKLSGKNGDELIIGARNDVTEDKAKRNPADFVLWFTISKFENHALKWDSPWGIGYPGWHIECSGISAKYLGEYLDIHCGGVDNIFPHHTNEIAQSEAYFGHKWCNYWLHGEHLMDKTGKMSKSKGEKLILSSLTAKGYNPLSYRYFCLGSHYRKQLIFSYESLDVANQAYQKLLNKIKEISDEGLLEDKRIDYENAFLNAINNDLNTAMMLTTIYEVIKSDLNGHTKLYLLNIFDQVLGLDLLKIKTINNILNAKEIEKKIQERLLAKTNKDYQKADEIRDELLKKGIKLIDTKDGTNYEKN